MLPELIKGLSAACQALGDRAGDRKHHKGIPSIIFLHDINICHTPLTMLYCTPGVRHLPIIELQNKPRGIVKYVCACVVCVRKHSYSCVTVYLNILFEGEREGLWMYSFFCLVSIIKH